jgi:DNA-binding beta-propeller fold protein YncE
VFRALLVILGSTVLKGRVFGVAFGASESEIWVLGETHVYKLDPRANRVLEATTHRGKPGLQGIRFDRASGEAVVSLLGRDAGTQRVRLDRFRDGKARGLAGGLGSSLAGSPAVAFALDSAGRRLVVVPLVKDNLLAVADLQSNHVVAKISVGIAPFAAVIEHSGATAFVSNWRGRVPTAKDLTASTGLSENADRVVVDERGIARTGTVTRVDLSSLKATATISVGLHPTGMVWDEPRQRLYVANGNQDSISGIDTAKNRVLETIALEPFQRHVAGIAPTAVQISPDGRTLYVACGGINAVAVLSLASKRISGLIPTGWYPDSIDISTDGKQLVVGSLLGAGSGWRDAPQNRFVHADRGMVSVVDVPEPEQLANYSTAVAENNHMLLAGTPVAPSVVGKALPAAIPARAGDPSLIKHVVYIIKENRTYDQLFGDLPEGNSDPSMVMFGRDVTPNQHRLAEQFVLLDNVFATGGNSADGHQWLTQANETDYCLWPGYAGRSYPFDGTDPLAYSQGGFIWDAALARHKTVRVYGNSPVTLIISPPTPGRPSSSDGARVRTSLTSGIQLPRLLHSIKFWRRNIPAIPPRFRTWCVRGFSSRI